MAVSTSMQRVITEASSAWRHLNGVVCLYKPLGTSIRKAQRDLRHKLCLDLNSLKRIERQEIVKFRRITNIETLDTSSSEGNNVITRVDDGKGIIEVLKCTSLADHPLVVGPAYTNEDIKLSSLQHLGKDSSGLLILGVNKGCKTIRLLTQHKWLRNYVVSGQFGLATDTFFYTGKVLEKTTFHRIKKHMIDRMLSSSQASFQRLAFAASGVPLDSEKAYEMASEGLVRPENTSFPIIYSLKCTKFEPPDFDIEICSINETEPYLRQFIHELGLRLNNTAVCTKIRCIKIGPFELDLALLEKHWTMENIISNMNQTSKILQKINLYERQPLVGEI